MVNAAELTSADTVIEVGPGLGILTEELARLARRVIAIEVDPKLASALARLPNLTILNADVLQVDPSQLMGTEHLSYKVVANLPYYITSPILRHFLEASLKPHLMVVMVQKEVAESIVAEPGEMGLLSVSVQLYGKPVIVHYVPAQAFYPPPKVDSAIVRIDVYQRPAAEVGDVDGFFEVVRAGFSAPRKQLHNALANGLGLSTQRAIELLNQAGISHKRRAQTLALEEWARLYQTVGGQRC